MKQFWNPRSRSDLLPPLAETPSPRAVGPWREYIEFIIEMMVFVFFVNAFLLQSFAIPSGSMENTMLIGDHLLVDKVAYSRLVSVIDRLLLPQIEIRRGMIVTFKSPPEMDKEYVKRVIGLPGETIAIVAKRVYIDGRPLVEPYARFRDPQVTSGIRDNFPPFRVPPGSYFCLGDNRDNSYDCRFWGPVPADYISGCPWRIFWSYRATAEEYRNPGALAKLRDLASTVVHFFSKTRWSRTFHRFR
jgi:signal peptidase I